MLIRGFFALLFCLLAVPAWAFPSTPILDPFTGSDGTTPPNANWTNAVLVGATSGTLVIQDNAVSTSIDSVDGDAYWNPSTFGAACEAYATIVNIASNIFGSVYCRLANIGANTTDGYGVEWADAASTIDIRRIDNGVATKLGASVSQTIAAGDKFGIRTLIDQICLWYKVGAGAWTELTCRTDATYLAGGYIGMTANGSTTVGELDDFGGGTVASTRRRTEPIIFQ